MKRTNEISKILGLILARSGSQRVRNKNARPFAGTTLLELAVEEALKATSPDRVGLSTDSPAYLELAESAGPARCSGRM